MRLFVVIALLFPMLGEAQASAQPTTHLRVTASVHVPGYPTDHVWASIQAEPYSWLFTTGGYKSYLSIIPHSKYGMSGTVDGTGNGWYIYVGCLPPGVCSRSYTFPHMTRTQTVCISGYFWLSGVIHSYSFDVCTPPIIASTNHKPVPVSVSTTGSPLLRGSLAPLTVVKRTWNNELLSISAHTTLTSGSLYLQYSRANASKPWMGKVTVTTPVLGKESFSKDLILVQQTGFVAGQASRRVVLHGTPRTERVNWNIHIPA